MESTLAGYGQVGEASIPVHGVLRPAARSWRLYAPVRPSGNVARSRGSVSGLPQRKTGPLPVTESPAPIAIERDRRLIICAAFIALGVPITAGKVVARRRHPEAN
jgi:hypothetical protein